jgi:hypothetical protein
MVRRSTGTISQHYFFSQVEIYANSLQSGLADDCEHRSRSTGNAVDERAEARLFRAYKLQNRGFVRIGRKDQLQYPVQAAGGAEPTRAPFQNSQADGAGRADFFILSSTYGTILSLQEILELRQLLAGPSGLCR